MSGAPDNTSLVAYHGTRERVDRLDVGKTVDGGLHFGTLEQATMRNSRWIYEAILDVDPLRIRRSRDRGGVWKKRVAEAKGKGFEAIVYLNRYEGVPLERIEEARRDGVDLDRLTDREFRKRVPEARDSWIIFDNSQVKILGITERNNPRNRPSRGST